VRVFTTRPDTLYGATYMVLAPEHPLVERLTASAWPAGVRFSRGKFPGQPRADSTPRELVAAYRRHAESKSDVERQVESKEKTGVFIGSFALNPVNREKIPIFIADYVLMGYGTGAIMAVPAHDQRDFEFAKQLDLPIKVVVRAPDGPASPSGELSSAAAADGISINSPVIEGLATGRAKTTITRWLEERGLGRGTVNYRLRDWLFSRQRYWGEPFPIVYDETGLPIALDESELPVELPELRDYAPETSEDPGAPPRPPLARAREWSTVTIGGKRYTRELNTMPNWAGSCWYYLRYLDPRNARHFVDPEVEKYWCRPADPKKIGAVDLYVGGVEHAVLHLLYARFWHKLLHDLGHVSTPEPFQRLFNQGYVQASAYRDERGIYVEASQVEEKAGSFLFEGKPVTREFGKMGKSLKNAVSPDEICADYGADTLRLYEMSMGPLDASKPWNTRDIIGVHRFLQRVWRNLVDEDTGELKLTPEPADEALLRALHKTIEGVRRDMESLGFNTAIAKLIELNNELTSRRGLPRETAESLVKMLAPLAPHVAEELWSRLGHRETIAYEPFPEARADLLVERQIEVPVSINGKVRARIHVAPGSSKELLETSALSSPKVQEQLGGKKVVKVIAVPDRMVNIVIG
jgi:leucyl-tRNA synthetase